MASLNRLARCPASMLRKTNHYQGVHLAQTPLHSLTSTSTRPIPSYPASLLNCSVSGSRGVGDQRHTLTIEEMESLKERSAINIDRSEYSKSGTDSEVASQHSSYDICYHNPEEVRTASDRETLDGGSGKMGPLEVSPANQDVSRFTDEWGRHYDGTVRGPSKRVSPKKGKRVDYGGAEVPGEHAAPTHRIQGDETPKP
ncbi:hypothetical protein FQN49_003340 [Arthroderma sp. PD_2]|nr:hypothetical protein FQN49_003340 [Arthroderma sp. PD_2]